MPVRVLITGASGFIGTHLVQGLHDTFDVEAPSSEQLDLLDADEVRVYLRKRRFDVVVHAATWDATRTSRKDLARVLENNLRMFHNVARDRGAFGRFVHLGSGAEYDRGRDLLNVGEAEFDAAVPRDQYGYAKYLQRKHCEATHGFVNLSLFGVFGAGEDWRLRFVSNACCHAALDMPIEVGRDAMFDYIAAEDVVAAVSWCVSHETEKRSFNVCSGVPRSLVDLAEIVREESGKDLPVTVRESGRSRAYVGDPGAFKAVSGWAASDLRVAVAALYHWYEARRDQIDRETLLTRAWSHTEASGAQARGG